MPKKVSLLVFLISTGVSVLLVAVAAFAFLGSVKTLGEKSIQLVQTEQAYSDYLVVQAQIAAHEAAKATIPDGYSDYQDSGVAYKWVGGGCSYYTRCSHLKLFAYEDCLNGIYVEANFTHNDTIVDYDNATVGSMVAGDTAKIKLESYNDNADQTQITQITCNK